MTYFFRHPCAIGEYVIGFSALASSSEAQARCSGYFLVTLLLLSRFLDFVFLVGY